MKWFNTQCYMLICVRACVRVRVQANNARKRHVTVVFSVLRGFDSFPCCRWWQNSMMSTQSVWRPSEIESPRCRQVVGTYTLLHPPPSALPTCEREWLASPCAHMSRGVCLLACSVALAAAFPSQCYSHVNAGLQTEELKAEKAQRYIVDKLLTLKCPNEDCQAAFLSFAGCFALTCHRCDCRFCAYCLHASGFGTEGSKAAHQHVANCKHNPPRVSCAVQLHAGPNRWCVCRRLFFLNPCCCCIHSTTLTGERAAQLFRRGRHGSE